MKKHLIAFGIVIILLAVGLSGCDELEELSKPDYITVTVNCDTHVQASYSGDIYDTMPVIGATVNVAIVKAGGERVEKNLVTDYKGDCEKVTATFKLYKEQPIVCYANVQLETVEIEYKGFVFNSAGYTIEWDYIYPLTDFGGSTQETIPLTITGIKTT